MKGGKGGKRERERVREGCLGKIGRERIFFCLSL